MPNYIQFEENKKRTNIALHILQSIELFSEGILPILSKGDDRAYYLLSL